jgi:type IV secretion system protein VirB6
MWTQFFIWLNSQVNTFISVQVANVEGLLEPAVVTMATMYVMFWGWLHLTGNIQEPLIDGAKRIFTLAAILMFSIKIAANIGPILDIFVNSPQRLAAGILGATPMGSVDTIWTDGSSVGDALLAAGSIFEMSGISLIAAGVITYVVIGLTTVYVAFLLALSSVALAVLLALAPIFITFLLFDSTKRFFEAWIAQLANYSLVVILVSTVANLMLHAVMTPLQVAVSAGPAVTAAAALRMAVFSVFVLLILRQILPMSSGLASGVALATGNVVSGLVRRGLGTSGRVGRGMWDAATGSGTTRWDPISRKAGYWSARGVGAVGAVTGRRVQAGWRKIRPNSIGQG